MTLVEIDTIKVCTDCYFACHYGWHEHDGKWFAGESDDPCDREPLSKVKRFHIFDATCSNHYYGQHPEHGEDDLFGTYTEPCDYCGNRTDENGITEFSYSPCEGCGTRLGGSRYRMSLQLEQQ